MPLRSRTAPRAVARLSTRPEIGALAGRRPSCTGGARTSGHVTRSAVGVGAGASGAVRRGVLAGRPPGGTAYGPAAGTLPQSATRGEHGGRSRGGAGGSRGRGCRARVLPPGPAATADAGAGATAEGQELALPRAERDTARSLVALRNSRSVLPSAAPTSGSLPGPRTSTASDQDDHQVERRRGLPCAIPRPERAGPLAPRSYATLSRLSRTHARPTRRSLAYRFGSGLYYANSSRFSTEIKDVVEGADPPLR